MTFEFVNLGRGWWLYLMCQWLMFHCGRPVEVQLGLTFPPQIVVLVVPWSLEVAAGHWTPHQVWGLIPLIPGLTSLPSHKQERINTLSGRTAHYQQDTTWSDWAITTVATGSSWRKRSDVCEKFYFQKCWECWGEVRAVSGVVTWLVHHEVLQVQPSETPPHQSGPPGPASLGSLRPPDGDSP